MKNKISKLTTIALAMLLVSCGSLKKTTTTQPTTSPTDQTTQPTSQTDPRDAIIATLGDWQSLQTGGNISLKAGSNFSSAIQVRMVRDQAIYISLRPMLGIEVGKLIITADSLYAVDKIHKRYVAEKVSLLTAGIPVTVTDVQDIFLGRPFVIGMGTFTDSMKSLMTPSTEGSNLTLTASEQYKGYGYAFSFDKSNHIISLNIVPKGSTNAAYQVKYSDVKATQAGNISHSIKVDATVDKKKLNFTLSYKDIDWDKDVKIDRKIPSSYSRMSAKDLFSLFSN